MESLLNARSTPARESALKSSITRTAKKVRVSQPFNSVATSAVRALMTATGFRSERVIKHLHRVGIVKSRLPNGRVLRLWSRADDWVSNQIFWRGWDGYEPETVPLFYRLATRARTTIDVGAYVGLYTLLAALANPDGHVYAFEPLPDAFERLRKNVALNRLTNVHCINRAVGESDATAEFFTTPTQMPCSSSLSYEFMRSAGTLTSLPVRVATVDRFIAEENLDRVDLVKIDTESTEPQVLRGMTGTIRRDQPMIVCEVLMGRGSEGPIGDLVNELGYRAYLLTPSGPALRDRIEGHPEWLNYLFTALGPSEVGLL